MTEEQEVFLKHIQKKGLKRTSQRDLILDVFLRTEAHLSHEDLYRLVQKEDPTVGQTTVYRTLKLLTEAGLAREVRFGDGRTHYEHNYKHQHHDHMICTECGKNLKVKPQSAGKKVKCPHCGCATQSVIAASSLR